MSGSLSVSVRKIATGRFCFSSEGAVDIFYTYFFSTTKRAGTESSSDPTMDRSLSVDLPNTVNLAAVGGGGVGTCRFPVTN